MLNRQNVSKMLYELATMQLRSRHMVSQNFYRYIGLL